MNKPKYDVTVKLTDNDGNACAIIARVRTALKKHGVSNAEIEDFTHEAMDGDYDNVLQTCMRWVEVE